MENVNKDVFEHISSMEEPLATIDELLTGIYFIAMSCNGSNAGSAIMRIAMIAQEALKEAEEKRCTLWSLARRNPEALAELATEAAA